MQAVQSIEAQKLDRASEQAIREHYQAAVRAGLEGLTGSIAALAATKVGRDTVDAMLLEHSHVILKLVMDGDTSSGRGKKAVAESVRTSRNQKRASREAK